MSTINQVREHPILFKTEMVRAILDGRKTQTRRVIKPQPERLGVGESAWRDEIYAYDHKDCDGDACEYACNGEWLECPYGKPGDELWVRETHTFWEDCSGLDHIKYKIGEPVPIPNTRDAADYVVGRFDKWRPSIHMPRWASRIQLVVEDVRVERVQEISASDALDEGVDLGGYSSNSRISDEYIVDTFRELWNSINADRGYPWEENPWVWVVEFKVKEEGS